MNRNYKDELGKVCDYISEHLDLDLTLDHLSQVANISKYHFHRLFSAHLGINIYPNASFYPRKFFALNLKHF